MFSLFSGMDHKGPSRRNTVVALFIPRETLENRATCCVTVTVTASICDALASRTARYNAGDFPE